MEQNKYEIEEFEFDKSHKKPYEKSDRYAERGEIQDGLDDYYLEEE